MKTIYLLILVSVLTRDVQKVLAIVLEINESSELEI